MESIDSTSCYQSTRIDIQNLFVRLQVRTLRVDLRLVYKLCNYSTRTSSPSITKIKVSRGIGVYEQGKAERDYLAIKLLNRFIKPSTSCFN